MCTVEQVEQGVAMGWEVFWREQGWKD